MNKIFAIISREYITRVRKRAFIIMTILGPLLFGTILIAPYKLASMEDTSDKIIAVMEFDSTGAPVDPDSMLFKGIFPDKKHLSFQYLQGVNDATMQVMLEEASYYAILTIDNSILNKKEARVSLFSVKQPSVDLETYIKQNLEGFIFVKNLERDSISPSQIGAAQTRIDLVSSRLNKDGGFKEQKMVDLKRGIGYAAGFLIYFFIFFFGAMVMRGVIEEKTNRVVEVIITSVRPFQLMMGKIIGIALVGLTQFLAWVLLTVGIYQFAVDTLMDTPQTPQTEQVAGQSPVGSGNEGLAGIFDALSTIEWQFYVYLLGTFLFYFLFGYLLYGAMFGAIGSAVDSETDTQQFMLPVTIPLILSIIVLVQAITNPEGQLVYWFSIIPFTSPVVMMARIPFHPPVADIILSMVLLVITFLAMTWLAGKIYRTGILMYGKKVSYREILKWIRFKN
ncbi:MAG: ABC transporter permease [Bacteroidales bacterium]|nr:ABC transporter permease [Bacteroidales bacterium]